MKTLILGWFFGHRGVGRNRFAHAEGKKSCAGEFYRRELFKGPRAEAGLSTSSAVNNLSPVVRSDSLMLSSSTVAGEKSVSQKFFRLIDDFRWLIENVLDQRLELFGGGILNFHSGFLGFSQQLGILQDFHE